MPAPLWSGSTSARVGNKWNERGISEKITIFSEMPLIFLVLFINSGIMAVCIIMFGGHTRLCGWFFK